MVKIAIMGMGVVGGGVAQIIQENSGLLSSRIQNSGYDGIEVKYVLDRRKFEGHPLEHKVTNDIDKILSDKEVSIVVETMGGIHPAYEFTKKALESGKSVVTSNKAIVSACGSELLECARKNKVSYMFEASVGGGIPIIRPLINCLAANNILSIYGILNGTTNYILTEMKRKGTAFADALKDAQSKGYAEADPTADIGGADTCRKICILSNIAYGTYIIPEDIHYEGITDIQTEDLSLADKLGYKIKLVGSASQDTEGRIAVFTAPVLIHEEHSIAPIDGVYNAISVTGDFVDDLLFCGQGAGALPTASAVVGDIIDIIKHHPKPVVWGKSDKSNLFGYGKIKSKYFVRVSGEEATDENIFGVFGKVTIVLGEDGKAFIAPYVSLDEQNCCLDKLRNKGIEIQRDLRVLDN
ncbi:MAG: hypothetical protein A2Y17_06060 [Clostridiales bacterium GWF2_38_85]|nr:MAG: hypothetical protein A2Y17_06060 [Clostridiales bacterium GWF2_38_85]